MSCVRKGRSCTCLGRSISIKSGPSPSARMNAPWPPGSGMGPSSCGTWSTVPCSGQAGIPTASRVWPLPPMDARSPAKEALFFGNMERFGQEYGIVNPLCSRFPIGHHCQKEILRSLPLSQAPLLTLLCDSGLIYFCSFKTGLSFIPGTLNTRRTAPKCTTSPCCKSSGCKGASGNSPRRVLLWLFRSSM